MVEKNLTENELKVMFPKAYKEIMENPIRYLWDNMHSARKLEVIKGITGNIELNEVRYENE